MAELTEVAQGVVSLIPSARGFGVATQRELAPQLATAGKKGGEDYSKGMKGRVSALAKGVFAPLAAAGAALGIKDFLGDALDEAKESQKVGRLTDQLIKQTGGSAKVTSKHVGDLASAISSKAGVDDEAVQSAANLLLTFKQVRNEAGKNNDIFDRATKATQDLAAAGFGDASSSAKMLGKALNDPVKGMTALSRAGVTFTEQQKAQVKALQKGGLDNAFGAMGQEVTNKQLEKLAKDEFGGDIDKAVRSLQSGWTKAQKKRFDYYAEGGHQLEAQKVILKEVESQVGGSAEATATWGEKAGVALGNLKEQVGTALLPVIERMSQTFTEKIAPAVSDFITGMQEGTGAGGEFRTRLSQAGSVLQAIGGFLVEHRRLVAAAVAGYAAWRVATTTVRAFNTVMLFGKGVQQGYAAATYGATLATKGQTVAEKVGLVLGKAKLAMTKAQIVAQRVLNAVMNMSPMGKVILLVTALVAVLVIAYKKHAGFRALVQKVWAAIKGAASTAVTWFKTKAWPWMRDVLGKIGAAAKTLWSTKIRPAFSAIGQAAKAVFGWIRDKGWPWVRNALQKIGGVVRWLWTNVYKRYLTFVLGIVKKVFGWVKDTGWPWMRRALTGIGTAARTLWTKWIKPNFERIKTGATAVRDTFRRVKDAIGKAWSGLTSAISGPIRSALNWINNNFLSKVRSMLKAIDLGDLAKKIPHLSVSVGPSKNGSRPMVGGNMPTKAAGGYIPGPWRGPKADNVLGVSDAGVPVARVNPREYILPVKATERLARQVGRGGLEMLRRGVLPGYAKGGLVGYAMGGDVAGLNPKFKKALDAFNDAVGGRYSVLDGWRSYAEQVVLWNRYKAGTGNLAAYPGTSNHGSGDAADLSPGDAGNRYAALAAKFGLHFPVTSPQWEPWHIELIGGGKGAQKGGPGGVGSALTGLAAKVYEKGASALNGLLDKIPGGFWSQVATAPLRMMTKNLASRVKDYGDSYAASALSASSVGSTALAGAGVERWRSTALKALKITGQPASLVDRLLMQMGTESSGNPRAINLTDINARRGDPSKGLMQVIGSTFRTYAMAPYNKDVYDPLSNIIASIRYALATYGSLSRAYQGHGYAHGGLVKPPVFDAGGVLSPGVNVVENRTGKPEALIRPEHIPVPVVKVFIGETELEDIVRTEIEYAGDFAEATAGMGRRV